MKFNVYLIYNRKVGSYERPIFNQDEPDEFVERVHRDYLASGNEARARILECDLIHIGSFDDNTGKIIFIEPNTLMNCSLFDNPNVIGKVG